MAEEDVSPCFNCKFARVIPGDYHICCVNPPALTLLVGAVGSGLGGTFDEYGASNFETREERLGYAWKKAAQFKCVVRRIWQRSGTFPYCFDPNTIFACSNYQAEQKMEI